MSPDYVIADFALAFLTTCAWASMIWRIASTKAHVTWPRWFILTGWVVLSVRLWWLLALYGDAPIHPVALISISCLAFGTVCLQITCPASFFWKHNRGEAK